MKVLILIDYPKAFDSPSFRHLHASWASFGLPIWVRRLLASLYTRAMSCILVVNGCFSPRIERTKGIFQGTVLSPHLFNIFTDELIHRLNPHFPQRTTLLAFADDHALLCSTITEAKDLLRSTIAWATPRGLNINCEKSLLLSETDTVLRVTPSISIKSARQGVCLGIPFTPAGIDWETHFTTSIKEASSHLRVLLFQTRSWPLMSRAHLYRTFVRPTMDYGMALFAVHTLDLHDGRPTQLADVWAQIKNFHSYACRLISRQQTNNRRLPEVLGEPCPVHRARETALRAMMLDAPYTTHTPKPDLLRTFWEWNASTPRAWPHAVSLKQRLSLFLKERAASIDRRIDYRLHPDTQIHLLHWWKKTFAYGTRCPCGAPFHQIQHTSCLPHPCGNINNLLAARNIEGIDETFDVWWETLHAN